MQILSGWEELEKHKEKRYQLGAFGCYKNWVTKSKSPLVYLATLTKASTWIGFNDLFNAFCTWGAYLPSFSSKQEGSSRNCCAMASAAVQQSLTSKALDEWLDSSQTSSLQASISCIKGYQKFTNNRKLWLAKNLNNPEIPTLPTKKPELSRKRSQCTRALGQWRDLLTFVGQSSISNSSNLKRFEVIKNDWKIFHGL